MRTSSFVPRTRILIVEDDALTALCLAELLSDEGFQVIGPVARRQEALSALEGYQPDAVVLDLSLRDGFCAGLARELRARSIPFLVFSGHRRVGSMLPELDDVPWIEKPGDAEAIVRELVVMTATSPARAATALMVA